MRSHNGLSQFVLVNPDIFTFNLTDQFCSLSSVYCEINKILTYILFSTILFVMVKHLGFFGEALMMSLESHDFLEEWLDGCMVYQLQLRPLLLNFECVHPELG